MEWHNIDIAMNCECCFYTTLELFLAPHVSLTFKQTKRFYAPT